MKEAFIVVDLGFGDSGKGAIVDAYTRKYNSNLVVRFNGGGQAGHNVVLEDGRNHIFASIGAGTLAGAATLLSKHFLLDPGLLDKEKEILKYNFPEIIPLIYIDERCKIVTPFHKMLNRLKEAFRNLHNGKHGSCGKGIGETMADHLAYPNDTLYAKDLDQRDVVFFKLKSLIDRFNIQINQLRKEYFYIGEAFIKDILDKYTFKPNLDELIDEYYYFAEANNRIDISMGSDLINESNSPIFEGAQGVLLDQDIGFHPYTTWSKTTPDNAHEILSEAGWKSKITKVGVMRTYMTRHGPGPFPTESKDRFYPQNTTNPYNGWQGDFRQGYLDLAAIKYAIKACRGVNELAVTHMDYIETVNDVIICEESYYHKNNGFWELYKYLPFNQKEQKELTDLLMKSVGFKRNFTIAKSPKVFVDCLQDKLKRYVSVYKNGPKCNQIVWLKNNETPTIKTEETCLT